MYASGTEVGCRCGQPTNIWKWILKARGLRTGLVRIWLTFRLLFSVLWFFQGSLSSAMKRRPDSTRISLVVSASQSLWVYLLAFDFLPSSFYRFIVGGSHAILKRFKVKQMSFFLFANKEISRICKTVDSRSQFPIDRLVLCLTFCLWGSLRSSKAKSLIKALVGYS